MTHENHNHPRSAAHGPVFYLTWLTLILGGYILSIWPVVWLENYSVICPL